LFQAHNKVKSTISFCLGQFSGTENGWVILIKLNTRQRMSDNQPSAWVADFPKEVLILLQVYQKIAEALVRNANVLP
jgi:hypothetical protein